MQIDDADRISRVEQTLATLVARVAELERPRLARIPHPAMPRDQLAALETRLGTFWLSRLGIVSLITGAALLIITYFGELGALLRVGLGYAMAAGLAWLGLRLARRHETFGRVVFGGGLAIGYFVTYALHFVPAMRIIQSETLGVVLVAVAIAGIVATAHRMKSETVAGIALFLGLHTGMLSDVTALSLVCTTLLAAGAGFFLAANRWVIVPLSTVIAVYATHATLAVHGGGVAPALSIAFLSVDFALFAGAALMRPDLRARSLVLLAVLNWLGAIALGSHALRAGSTDPIFAYLCAFAVAHAVLAAVARWRGAPRPFVGFLLGLALATLALALPARLDGWTLAGGWIALAVAAAYLARRAEWPAFGVVALVLAALVQACVRVDVLGVPGQLACVLTWFAVERLHARGDRHAPLRILMIAGASLGLLQLGVAAFAADYHSIAWVGAALALFALGFALRSSPYRWAGFAVLGITALRFLAVQMPVLSAKGRISTFVVAGAVLLVVSFVYTRIRARASD